MFGKKKKQDDDQSWVDQSAQRKNMSVTGETIKLQDVENFFYYTINPHLIETKIEKQSMALAKERGGLNPNMIILLIFVLIGSAIAYSMVSNTAQLQDLTNKYIGCAAQLASKSQPVITAVTETTTTTKPPFSIT